MIYRAFETHSDAPELGPKSNACSSPSLPPPSTHPLYPSNPPFQYQINNNTSPFNLPTTKNAMQMQQKSIINKSALFSPPAPMSVIMMMMLMVATPAQMTMGMSQIMSMLRSTKPKKMTKLAETASTTMHKFYPTNSVSKLMRMMTCNVQHILSVS